MIFLVTKVAGGERRSKTPQDWASFRVLYPQTAEWIESYLARHQRLAKKVSGKIPASLRLSKIQLVDEIMREKGKETSTFIIPLSPIVF